MAEITDAQLAELTQARALLKSLYDDSAVGMKFRKIVKEKFPNTSIPELDALERVESMSGDVNKKFEEVATGVSKKIDDFLAAQQKKEEDAQVKAYEERFNKIVKDRGYTEEGTKKLVDLMQSKGIRDPEDAAILFESTQPKPVPAQKSYTTRMAFVTPDSKDDDAYNRLMADPDQFAADELTNAINNARQEE